MPEGLIPLPPHLYKYIDWQKSYHRKIVTENTIFFSSPQRFNDPFDSAVGLNYELGNKDDLTCMFRHNIHLDNPILSYREVSKLAEEHYRRRDFKDPEFVSMHLEDQRRFVRERCGVFCVTEDYLNETMWAFYANGETGLCVRFNIDRLINFIENECVVNHLILFWGKVEYVDIYPLLNPFELSLIDQVTKPLLIKKKRWDFEDEYRFFSLDKTDFQLQLPNGIIDKIIIGRKFPLSEITKLRKIAEEQEFELARVIIDSLTNTYKLESI